MNYKWYCLIDGDNEIIRTVECFGDVPELHHFDLEAGENDYICECEVIVGIKIPEKG